MAKRIPEPTKPPRERAFLVGVEFRNDSNILPLEDSLEELALLANTAGLEVVGETTQKRDRPNPETLIGSGKVEEIITLVEETLTQVVVFDNELSPRHLRELEKKFGTKVRVIDRTALILDIFAQHAKTREGILQVQLAQYEYLLPRLTRAWTHLARQSGGSAGRGGTGGVGLRGPGETQLEVDRREIKRQIYTLKEKLEKVRSHRSRYREKRKQSQIPTVALVGYTNAGKSTLLNRLTNAKVLVANRLFATLDPTTRSVVLPSGTKFLMTDTVGFIQKLPHQVVAAFRATLEEIAEADLLLLVVDITHPNAIAQWRAVQVTLADLQADHIPTVTVLNKIDRLPAPEHSQETLQFFEDAVAISAKKGQGIPDLLNTIEQRLFHELIPIKVELPYDQGNLISIFHAQGQVTKIEHGRGKVLMEGFIPGRLITQYQPFFIVAANSTEG
ncbi:MAG: GTPase HflX [Anaerolineaceae bacterium]|nr:GTPase HflX [Anaerolineaceae bacterium]